MSFGSYTTPSRWVVLDDSDARLQYTGRWSDIDGQPFDDIGNFGPTYRGRMHATTAADATVSLRFNGTAVSLQGFADAMGAPSFIERVKWECILDGTAEEGINTNTGLVPLNNYVLCFYRDLSPGEHTFSVRITSSGQRFYVDRVSYGASTSTTPETVQVDYTDPELQYSDVSWERFAGYRVLQTDQPQSSVSLDFTGTAVVWYGSAPEPSLSASSATYQIDNQDPVPFNIRGNLETPELFQKYFETADLESGSHKLTVKYEGTIGAMPLSLSYLEISGATGTGITGNSSSPVATPTAIVEGETGTPVGPIVGGVVGGIAFLTILGLFVWYLVRRHRTASRNHTPGIVASSRKSVSSVSSDDSEKYLK
ncbi:unnamed protein product [Cyclocybe aegerita]|uniref:Transmembrane protein n=1 Tax=Cyclocybe aegerita TaxID=1973307 RepID=A0A8S0VWJ7_CYCAE|nr:unnamed protein product [Cyclocybe aegerita]